jgi:putative hydrolase of the HAD superfamily
LYFDYALKMSGAERETTLMIGDNLQTDIQGALNAGIDALLFNRWNVNPEEANKRPTFVVDRLLDIKNLL